MSCLKIRDKITRRNAIVVGARTRVIVITTENHQISYLPCVLQQTHKKNVATRATFADSLGVLFHPLLDSSHSLFFDVRTFCKTQILRGIFLWRARPWTWEEKTLACTHRTYSYMWVRREDLPTCAVLSSYKKCSLADGPPTNPPNNRSMNRRAGQEMKQVLPANTHVYICFISQAVSDMGSLWEITLILFSAYWRPFCVRSTEQ